MNRFVALLPLLLLSGSAPFADAADNPVAEALAAQRARVAEAPGDPALLNDLANLEVLSGDEAAAEASYRRALRIAPGDADLHFNLGLLLQEESRFAEAKTQYDAAIQARPDHAWAHYQLGVLLHEEGRADEAVDAYARAFELDPQLSFSNVNPHVIDNELYTRALLKAFQHGAERVAAPRTYREPGRITGLLIGTAGLTPGEVGTETPMTAGAHSAGAPAPGPREPSAGDAPAGASAPHRAEVAGSVGRSDTGGVAGAPGQPAPRSAPRAPGEMPDDAMEPYRPGQVSTGRMDIRLETPATDAAAAPAPARAR